jgi:hypothetical protein
MDPQINPEGKNENADRQPNNPASAALPDKDKAQKVEKKEESPADKAGKCKEEKPCCSPIPIVDKTPDEWNKAKVISIVAAATNVIIIFAYALLWTQGQNAAKETRREFKALNEPYLEITLPRLAFRDSPMTVAIIIIPLKTLSHFQPK